MRSHRDRLYHNQYVGLANRSVDGLYLLSRKSKVGGVLRRGTKVVMNKECSGARSLLYSTADNIPSVIEAGRMQVL